jgi:AsmA family
MKSSWPFSKAKKHRYCYPKEKTGWAARPLKELHVKKLLWILGGLFFALLVAIVSIPLFVDVDQYRPTIVSQANQRINGQLELGHLNLSLWGAIKIHADSIKVSVNGFPGAMLDTKQFHLEIPFLSVLSGAPQVIAVLDSPKISVVKEASGKMNVMELIKTVPAAPTATPAAPGAAPAKTSMVTDKLPAQVSAASAKEAAKKPAGGKAVNNTVPKAESAAPAVPSAPAAPVAATAPAAPAKPAEPMKVPALVAGAKLGLRITNGDLNYTDKLAKAEYQVIGLDVDARNLGLGSTMNLTIKAPVKGSSPTMSFEGPIEAVAEITPVLVNGVVKAAKGDVDFDATKLKVEMKGGVFHKTDSMPLTAKAQFDGNDKETVIKQLDLDFADMKIRGKGRVAREPMAAKVEINSDPLNLAKVETFVPMAAAYGLKGTANLNVNVDWKPEALHANGDLQVTQGSVFMKEMLKAPLDFQIKAGFSENSFTLVKAALSGPDSELELTGNVKNFLAPQFSFALNGKSFNVDKTLVLPAAGAAKPKTASVLRLVDEAVAAEGAKPAADVNPMLELAKNPMILGAGGTVTAQLGRLTAYGANFDQINVRAQMQALKIGLQEASLKTFGGSIKSTGEFDLKNPGLLYHSVGTVSGISAKEAFTTYFPKFANTLEGTVDASWNVSGGAFPAATRIRSIKGGAKLVARDGAVKSVDFQGSINSALANVPFLHGKSVHVDNGFKTLSCEIKFDNGTIKADPFEAQPRGQGFVLKGKSAIKEDLTQDTYVDVYDPQGQLPKEIQAPAGKPALALHVTGPISSPQTDYGYTVSRLAQNAGKNALKNGAAKALSGLLGGNKGGDQSNNNNSDPLKNAGDLLKKKIKF